MLPTRPRAHARAGVAAGALLLGLASGAAAQTPSASATPPAPVSQSVASPIDVYRLPVGLDRIQRQLRRAQDQSTREGLNLSFLVQVYAPAPPLVLFTEADRLTLDLAPGGAPTHREMFTSVAPTAFRASTSMAFRRPKAKASK